MWKYGLLFLILLAHQNTLWGALPKFLGGSGMGITGQKANIDGKYQTYWEGLMQTQSYDNMRQGMGELSAAKYKEASQIFAKAVVKNPNEPYPHIFLGISLYWLGQVEPAMAEYRAALKLDPTNAHAHQLLGIAYAWQGKIKEALSSFQTALKYAPDRPDTHMNIGSTLAALGKLDDALYHFRTAADLDKRHPLYQYQLASLYETLGRDNLAESAFRRALKLYPTYEEAMLALAVLYEKMSSYSSAEMYYKKALKIKAGDSIARARLINLLMGKGRQKDALDLMSRAFLISPIDGEGLALSITYTGGTNASDTQGQALPNPAQKNKQLEQFKKRLKRVPSSKQINIDIELLLEPKLTPDKIKDAHNLEGAPKSSFINSVDQEDKKLNTTIFNRSFVLVPSDEETRQNQLENIFNGLNNILNEASPQYDVKMALKAGTPTASPNSLEGAENGVSQVSAMRNTKAGYNPYMVGNDMGLWVTGKGWLRYVEEILPDVNTRLENNQDFANFMTAGLVYITLGQGQKAQENFLKAKGFASNNDLMQLALLGEGTSFIILGDEEQALAVYEQALKLNPENKIALSNIEILKE